MNPMKLLVMVEWMLNYCNFMRKQIHLSFYHGIPFELWEGKKDLISPDNRPSLSLSLSGSKANLALSFSSGPFFGYRTVGLINVTRFGGSERERERERGKEREREREGRRLRAKWFIVCSYVTRLVLVSERSFLSLCSKHPLLPTQYNGDTGANKINDRLQLSHSTQRETERTS